MSFKSLTPWFKEVFTNLDSACQELNIPLYLIGAQARHFHWAEKGIRPGRGTMDIDFAIMLPGMDLYGQLIGKLISNGFRKEKEPYRLVFDKTNTVVDLLPFGKVEEKGTIRFTNRRTNYRLLA